MRRMAAVALLLCAGCTAIPQKTVKEAVSPAPYQPWTPPAKAAMPPSPVDKTAPQVPEEYLKPGTTLSLVQLVDIGLRGNPATQEAWSFARAAAAEVGSKRSLYFPIIEIDGQLQRQKTAAVGGRFTFLQTTYGPSVAASWLLFDFGGREADVQEATRALYAADWTHNAAIQDVVLSIAQAYYGYLNSKALVLARQANLDEARRSLDAAEERHRAGVATIADVLQARTSASQIELELQDTQGQLQIIRGALATAIGVSANVPVDVGQLPEDLPLDIVKKNVDELIATAMAERPDLAASRFAALAAQSRIRSVAAEGLPKLSAVGQRQSHLLLHAQRRRSLLDELLGRHPAAHPRLHGVRRRIPDPEGEGRGRGGQRERREARRPRDPGRLVELLRRPDLDAAHRHDARPAGQREAVGRRRGGPIQGRGRIHHRSADRPVGPGGRPGGGSPGAFALVPRDGAAGAFDRSPGPEGRRDHEHIDTEAGDAMTRGVIRVLLPTIALAGFALGCAKADKAAAVEAVPVRVGHGRTEGRAGRAAQRRHGAAVQHRRRARPRQRGDPRGPLPRRAGRAQGRSSLHDRPAALPGGARPGGGDARARPGAARERPGRRRALRRARQEGLRHPGAVRQRQGQRRGLAATVRADEAAIEKARLDLAYCTIRSPLAGRTGVVIVQAGNVVKANDDDRSSDQPGRRRSTWPFSVPSATCSRSAQRQRTGPPRRRCAGSRSGRASPTGELTFIDNTVDATTGTIKLKATFANARPPALARAVRERRAHARDARPARSSSRRAPSRRASRARYVYVVKADDTVGLAAGHGRPAAARSEPPSIANGLTAGERVVTDGQLRLRARREGRDPRSREGRGGQALMNISELFIRRPVTTTLVMVGILLFGVMGYRLLPVTDLPNVDFPTIQVTASLPGASPETMASSVATPLEQQFSTIAGLDSMNSSSIAGLDADHAAVQPVAATSTRAAQDVQAAIAAAARQLPPDMPTPAVVPEGEPGRPADPLPRADLADAAALAARRVRRDDDGAADLDGLRASRRCRSSARRSTRCASSSTRGARLAAASASTRCPRPSQGANVNLPTGTLYGPRPAFTVQANGQLDDAAGYRPVIVAYRNGAPVRLEDLGRVIDSVENDKTAAWYNDERVDHPRDPASSPAPTRSRSPRRCAGSCRRSRRSCPASVDAARPLRPLGSRSATRSTT